MKLIIELFKSVEPKLAEKLPKVDDIADAYYMSKFARQIYIDNNKEEN